MNFKNQISTKIEELKKSNNNFSNKALYGLEKETLRITEKGNLSVNQHPKALGSKLTSKFITTDYSESQLELITEPKNSVEQAVEYLNHITYYISQNIGHQLLWPCSMPCILPNEKEIPIAYYGNSNQGKLKELYRIGLKYRYGKTMQMISGVHFNFSFSHEFLQQYIKLTNNIDNINQNDIDNIYLSLSRNYLRFGWVLNYLFGASPIVHVKFLNNKSPTALYLKPDSRNFKETHEYYAQYGTSLRMSELGYHNKKLSENMVSLNSLDNYINDLAKAISTENSEFLKIGVKTQNNKYLQINANNLQIENELYSPIRLKSQKDKNLSNLKNLAKSGIQYIELRNIDVNPFALAGFEVHQGYFTEIFLFFCMLLDSPEFASNKLELLAINSNLGKITTFGRHEGLTIRYQNQDVFLQDLLKEIFESLEVIAEFLDSISNSKEQKYKIAFDKYKNALNNHQTYSEQIYNNIYNLDSNKFNSFQDFGLNIAIQNKKYLDEEFKSNINQDIINEIKTDISNSLQEFEKIENTKEISFDEFLNNFNKTQDQL